MHPTDHYDTLRRGREELLRRAEYERMARKEMIEQGMNKTIHRVAKLLGTRLVSWGEKLEKFGPFAKRQPAPTTQTRAGDRSLSKMSPHH